MKPSREFKVVAFLQNMWFKRPEVMRQQLAESFKGDRERFIRVWLFWSCRTGKNLRNALGEEWVAEIVWEEQSPEMGGKASAAFPPDLLHICQVIQKHKPTHVLAFGVLAQMAIESITPGFPEYYKLVKLPHPTARQPGVMDKLRELKVQLDAWKREAAFTGQA